MRCGQSLMSSPSAGELLLFPFFVLMFYLRVFGMQNFEEGKGKKKTPSG